jgi:hypothetical protein
MKRISCAVVFVLFCLSCRENYDPPVVATNKSILVVEGNLDPQGPAVVSLSRVSSLETRTGIKVENNAVVTVEDRNNNVRGLVQSNPGTYTSSGLGLTIDNEYRLHIKTSDGKEYLSAYVKAKQTPAVDSISWEYVDDGVQIYANTHDATGRSQYYRWEYDETWEIRTQFFSDVIYDATTNRVRPRSFPVEDVSTCWKYDRSTTILLANSTRLQSDVIYKTPLILIPNGSERLSVRYSILVRQYALDRGAYNFYELMKKNTEQVGSIFSPQPTELVGNITCVSHPEEYVLGYVTASTIVQQRLFIKIPWNFRQDCDDILVPNNPDSLKFFFGQGTYMPYSFVSPPPGYKSSTPNCVDCTRRGGSTFRPPYW